MGFSSCSIKARIKRADKKYAIGEFYDAGDIYRSCYKKVPQKDKVLRGYVAFRQAECYHKLNNGKAINAYQAAIRNQYSDSIIYLHYAQALHYQGKYSDALKQYKIYLEAHPTDPLAQQGVYSCLHAAGWKKEYSRYKIKPVLAFNQRRTSNLAPAFIGTEADALMFTSNRTSSSKKLQRNSAITGTPLYAIYSTRRNAAGKWGEIEKLEELYGDNEVVGSNDATDIEGTDKGASKQSTSDKEQEESEKGQTADIGICCFTADGKTMYFTYSKPKTGEDLGTQIYVSNRASGTWSEPQQVKIFRDSSITVAHPSVSALGDTLYFVSDTAGGYGGYDLYFAEREGDSWINITNLGPAINTSGNEMYPTIRRSGELYFSSDGHSGFGGLDLYKALHTDSVWIVQNMGPAFNSSYDEFGITFAGDKEEGFFTSNKSNTKKGYDEIFSFILPQMVFEVEGIVRDNLGEPIGAAFLRLVGDDGTNARVQVKKDGTYKLKLQKGHQYAMMATARGYLNQKQTFHTLNLQDSHTEEQNFTLSPISKPVVMNNVFYKFGKWDVTPESIQELQTLKKMLEDNPNITIELSAHTDYIGDSLYNKELSEKRAQAAVEYLISQGIEKVRLTPVGYGENKPVIADVALHKQYDFIPLEQPLTEEFIRSLKDEAEQEICNQINRRTEFKVLKTTYKLY